MLSVGSLSFTSSAGVRTFGPGHAEVARQHRLDVGGLVERLAFGRRQRPDVAVEVLDGHAPLVVLHRGEELGQGHRRVRGPVAVVARMQVAGRAVDGDGDAGAATHAEVHRRPTARVPRPVERDRQVGLERLRPGLGEAAEVGRAGLLLAVEHDPDVPGRAAAAGLQRVDGVQQGDDRPLVVGGRAAVEPPLRIERACAPDRGATAPALLHRHGVNGWQRVHWLASTGCPS